MVLRLSAMFLEPKVKNNLFSLVKINLEHKWQDKSVSELYGKKNNEGPYKAQSSNYIETLHCTSRQSKEVFPFSRLSYALPIIFF